MFFFIGVTVLFNKTWYATIRVAWNYYIKYVIDTCNNQLITPNNKDYKVSETETNTVLIKRLA